LAVDSALLRGDSKHESHRIARFGSEYSARLDDIFAFACSHPANFAGWQLERTVGKDALLTRRFIERDVG
jgi:hypothetical protein